MEVIKRGNITEREYILVCRICGCVAKFVQSDIQRYRDGEYIVCPECKRFISTDSDYIRELKEEK